MDTACLLCVTKRESTEYPPDLPRGKEKDCSLVVKCWRPWKLAPRLAAQGRVTHFSETSVFCLFRFCKKLAHTSWNFVLVSGFVLFLLLFKTFAGVKKKFHFGGIFKRKSLLLVNFEPQTNLAAGLVTDDLCCCDPKSGLRLLFRPWLAISPYNKIQLMSLWKKSSISDTNMLIHCLLWNFACFRPETKPSHLKSWRSPSCIYSWLRCTWSGRCPACTRPIRQRRGKKEIICCAPSLFVGHPNPQPTHPHAKEEEEQWQSCPRLQINFCPVSWAGLNCQRKVIFVFAIL